MTEFAWACALFALLATLLHLASTLLAARRLRRTTERVHFAGGPPVSLLRTVRGLDPYDELTLRSGFELSYHNYELILCCDDAHDPVAKPTGDPVKKVVDRRTFYGGQPNM